MGGERPGHDGSVAAGPALDAPDAPAAPAPDAPVGQEVVGFAVAGPDGVMIPIFGEEDGPEAERGAGGHDHLAAGAAPAEAAARRARGLDAPFPPGGEDDATDVRRRRERRDLRLLIFMVAALVGIPTVLTFVALIADLIARRGGG